MGEISPHSSGACRWIVSRYPNRCLRGAGLYGRQRFPLRNRHAQKCTLSFQSWSSQRSNRSDSWTSWAAPAGLSSGLRPAAFMHPISIWLACWLPLSRFTRLPTRESSCPAGQASSRDVETDVPGIMGVLAACWSWYSMSKVHHHHHHHHIEGTPRYSWWWYISLAIQPSGAVS